jgi:hypothetical protein
MTLRHIFSSQKMRMAAAAAFAGAAVMTPETNPTRRG